MPKIKTLNKDTISFGHLNEPIPKDLQLYRCIGESEYKALLNGETINFAYSTSDPRGWEAWDWHNGFNAGKKDIYFVTYKTIDEDLIMDKRDYAKDTRYMVDEYNLTNVKNIRKGYNAHGVLVYAENFESALNSDKKEKTKEINRLIGDIKATKKTLALVRRTTSKTIQGKINSSEELEYKKLKKIYDELASYAEEFPDVVDKLKPVSKDDIYCKKFLPDVIRDANRQEDLQLARNILRELLDKNLPIDEVVLIGEYGSNEDVDLLLDIAKSDKNKAWVDIALSKIADTKSYPIIEDTYLNGNAKVQEKMIEFFEGKDALKIARLTLEKYKNNKREITPYVKYHCFGILGRKGSLEDIPLLEKWDSFDAEEEIKKIKKRLAQV